jgi:hypothetical protein
MCPACGSIDLNLMTVERAAPPVMRAREATPVEQWRAPQQQTALP